MCTIHPSRLHFKMKIFFFFSKCQNWVFRWKWQTFLLWCMPDFSSHLVCFDHISKSNQPIETQFFGVFFVFFSVICYTQMYIIIHKKRSVATSFSSDWKESFRFIHWPFQQVTFRLFLRHSFVQASHWVIHLTDLHKILSCSQSKQV